YNREWNIKNIDRHSIFCSQAGYPIKGFHFMLKALEILKDIYPDIKLFVAGPNIIDKSSLTKRLKITGYANYIVKLIKKYKIEDKVIFTGILKEQDMAKRLQKTHIFSSNSILENESNSLSEAAILGVPAVVSYVGGIPDRVEQRKNGFLYPYTEYSMLVEYIRQVFDDDELAIKFSVESRKKALTRHDRVENCKRTIEIYKEIIEGKSER
ncbi:MAG: glycosyltransferase family 4 protein, partial [Bacilli bacterium]|nr:glycosyltransferase family 4 protein [Bacilli bacterium]